MQGANSTKQSIKPQKIKKNSPTTPKKKKTREKNPIYNSLIIFINYLNYFLNSSYGTFHDFLFFLN